MTGQGISLAIVGVSSAAGEALLETLPEQPWATTNLQLLDAREAATGRIEVQGHYQVVGVVDDFDFAGVDVVVFACAPGLAEQHMARARAAGCFVLDLSGASSLAGDVPLVVAGVNDDLLADLERGTVIAGPDPLAVQLCLLLKPLIDSGLSPHRLDAVACRAVNMHGKSGSEALAYETVQLLNMRQPEHFDLGRQIAFNLLPTGPEVAAAIRQQVKKVLFNQELDVNLRVVDSAVFNANSLQCFVDFDRPCEIAQVHDSWASAAGLEMFTDGQAPSAVTEAAGSLHTVVGGLESLDGERPGISVWSVADGLQAGVANNTWGIVEILVKFVL